MRRALIILRRCLLAVAFLIALVYAGDYLSVWYDIPKSRHAYGAVTIQRYYSVTKKNGKPDFYFDPPTEQTCVNSLFPHLGYSPCWYLKRHKVQRIDM